MRRRPYQWKTNDYLFQLFRDYSDDFVVMKDVVYEVAFRKTVHKNQRSEIVDHFLEMVEYIVKDPIALKTKIDESTLKIFLLEQRIRELEQQQSEYPDFPFPEINLQITRLDYIEEKGSINWGNFGQGLLSASGYRVGKTKGETEENRRRILNYIFLKDTLDDIENEEYKAEWGQPKTSDRLQKLANVLATFANNALRKKSGDFSKAIWDWHSDLQYIEKSFYKNWGDFPWPEIEAEFE